MADSTPPVGHKSDSKSLNQAQFGANAENYATSAVHAKGASLDRMVELTRPEPHWRGLDIATAAGHTALAFAPHVASMVAADLTVEMVALTRRRGNELGVTNVPVAQADAEGLPFGGASFDLVTCRIAPHHFPHQAKFVEEVARVLRPGGLFALVDNIVPDDDPDTAVWYDDWERLRDPSHIRCLSMSEWEELTTGAGLVVEAAETAPKRMQFLAWVNNMSVPAEVRPELLNSLMDAEPAASAFLQPLGTTQEDAGFQLTEGLIIARKPTGANGTSSRRSAR